MPDGRLEQLFRRGKARTESLFACTRDPKTAVARTPKTASRGPEALLAADSQKPPWISSSCLQWTSCL
jgi:hypothetical protein